jgi:hypothetical protein
VADSPSDRLSSALEARYAIEREIGAGGMATVYLARALVSDESRIFVRPYPDVASALHPISLGDADDPQWSADGKILYYETRLPEGGKDITAAHLRTEPDFEVLSRELFAPFQRGYTWTTGGWLFTVAPDGERALVSRWKDQSVEAGGMVLVQDFAEELRRRGRD